MLSLMSTDLIESKPKPDLPDIIRRYRSGESMLDIAPDYKVASRTLYRWLLGGLGDADYHDVVTDCLVNRVSDADDELRQASDACQVTRAREIARFARMDLERRRPGLYGQKSEAIVSFAPVLNIQIVHGDK